MPRLKNVVLLEMKFPDGGKKREVYRSFNDLERLRAGKTEGGPQLPKPDFLARAIRTNGVWTRTKSKKEGSWTASVWKKDILEA